MSMLNMMGNNVSYSDVFKYILPAVSFSYRIKSTLFYIPDDIHDKLVKWV